MAESALNARVLKALQAFHAFRVENGVLPGTPDINCTLGWIEDKFLARWPKSGIVKCDHYVPAQRVFAVKRSRAKGPGNRVWFIIQIGKDVLVFRGEVAALHVGRVDEATLRSLALKVWHGTLVESELAELLLADCGMVERA